MTIEQIYTGCLAQGAYYLQSGDEAAIIDPLRETQPYLKKAKENGATIKYIFETHFHADFVSGHVDLARQTGAKIVYGPTAKTAFESHTAQDGEIFHLGRLGIQLLHTPGHTMESSCFLLRDEQEKPVALFSGDTLFIGDVGRPDLAVQTDLSKEDLAGHLFDSLRNKIMPLPDEVVVYPAHGAGSACGRNLSTNTWDTLGNQKQTNHALAKEMTKATFVKEVTQGILPPPQYFPKNARMNQSGYASLDHVLKTGDVALDVDTFQALVQHEGAMVLDTRHQDEFTKAHIPNAIFIGIDGAFAPWVGALITDLNQPIVFLAEEGRAQEVVTRLSRVGYDHTLGYLKGGIAAWQAAGKPTASLPSISPKTLEERLKTQHLHVLDVRKPHEFEAGHVVHATSFPLDFINQNMGDIQPDRPYHIHCASGYRSVIAASILKARGAHHVINVAEGFKGISETKIDVTGVACPSTIA